MEKNAKRQKDRQKVRKKEGKMACVLQKVASIFSFFPFLLTL